MIDYLVIILCGLVFIQPTWQRARIAGLYSGLCLFFMVIEPELGDMHYYVLPAYFDLLVIIYIFKRANQTRFTDMMITVSALSLLVNFFGWVLYDRGMEPDSFIQVFHVVYFLAIYTFLGKDKADESNADNWMGILPLPNTPGTNIFRPLYKKATTWQTN